MASKCTAIDSCVLLRVIRQDIIPLREKAMRLLLSGADFYVDDVVILEMVYALTKMQMPRDQIAENILLLLESPMFVWDKKFFEPIFEKYVTRPSLSFDDLVLAARVVEKGYEPLWTFDRKFANQTEVAELV